MCCLPSFHSTISLFIFVSFTAERCSCIRGTILNLYDTGLHTGVLRPATSPDSSAITWELKKMQIFRPHPNLLESAILVQGRGWVWKGQQYGILISPPGNSKARQNLGFISDGENPEVRKCSWRDPLILNLSLGSYLSDPLSTHIYQHTSPFKTLTNGNFH